MHGDLMALEVLRLDKGGTGDDAGADGEERPLDSLLVEIRKQVGRVGRRAVIVRQTPVVLKPDPQVEGELQTIMWYKLESGN